MKSFFQIKSDFENSRLDRWFRKNVSDVPQSLIEKNIRKGNIKVNNTKKKGSYKLKITYKISIFNIKFTKGKNKRKTIKYKATSKELLSSSSIFIEDNENFVVINKPAGIPVQSGTKSIRNLMDILRDTAEFKNCSPFSVHRLDKETTGILIVAKNRKYAQLFTSLFRIRKIHKVYLGVVMGRMAKKKGTLINELLTYERKKIIKNKAITHYSVLNDNNNYSLLKLSPETGRKHQIRKQLLIHGNPILGDSKYRLSNSTVKKKNVLMLHAFKINFSINNVRYNFTAKPSDYFEKTINEKYLKIF